MRNTVIRPSPEALVIAQMATRLLASRARYNDPPLSQEDMDEAVVEAMCILDASIDKLEELGQTWEQRCEAQDK